ncbi:MAG: sigma-70 family RNA polymerase sigma factor [Burkholderiaceae bacterium]
MRKPAELTHDEARALLERIGRRDESALRELHDRLARRIFLFAMARLRNEEAAETVMSDTLFEIWKHPDRFRGESRFSTWVLGIAKYKVLSTLRAADDIHEDVDDYAETLADPDADVAGEIEAQQESIVLRECIEKLNDAQREAIQLVFFEGMALGEIATIQSVPEGTVKTRLFHARKNLKTCVQTRLGGED